MNKTMTTLALAIAALLTVSCGHRCEFTDKQFETPDIPQGMQIHATFLDEISWDIPFMMPLVSSTQRRPFRFT